MEYALGNVFIRDNNSPHDAGWRMDGHKHKFDHTTYVVAGVYRCMKWRQILNADGAPMLNDGAEMWHLVADQVVKAPHFFLVAAEDKHSFECAEGPGILHCIYSHREPQTGEVVQKWTGWREAVV